MKSPNFKRTPTKKNTYFENYDLYSDANPKDTIHIKYDTVENTKKTIKKLEKLREKGTYSHARIVRVVNVMTQRLRVIYNNTGKGKTRYELSKRYFEKLKKDTVKKRKEKTNYKSQSNLNRWFKEEWIDVCQLPKIVKCGRDKANWKDYPYCRPLKRINKSTPKTANELTKAEIKKRCAKKKQKPKSRILPKSRRKSPTKSSKSRRKSPTKSSKSRRKSPVKNISEPVNKKLYNEVKKEAKTRFKVWPSAYASGWLVKEYKRRGGKYKLQKSSKFSTEKKWFIVTKEGCPSCIKAKDFLETKNIKVKYESYNNENKNVAIKKYSKKTNNYEYFPMIFYNNKFIGGFVDLEKKFDSL
jgi:glutaredoxin